MYRAPIRSGRGSMGLAIGEALSNIGSSISGGLQERYQREQEAERQRKEEERYQHQLKRERISDAIAGIHEGPAPRQAVKIEGSTSPVTVTKPQRETQIVGIAGGPSPIGEAIAIPQRRAPVATRQQPNTVDLGDGKHYDATRSAAYVQAEMQRAAQREEQAAEVAQRTQVFQTAGHNPEIAAAMALDEVYQRHILELAEEEAAQSGRLELENRRTANDLSLENRRSGNTLREIEARGKQDRSTVDHRAKTSGSTGGTASGPDGYGFGRITWPQARAAAMEELEAAGEEPSPVTVDALARQIFEGTSIRDPKPYMPGGQVPATVVSRRGSSMPRVRSEDEGEWRNDAAGSLVGEAIGAGAAAPAPIVIPSGLLQAATDDQLREAGYTDDEIETARRAQR